MNSKNVVQITTGWINVNVGCNNRCKHCYLDNTVEDHNLILDYKKGIKIIDFLAALKVQACIFIGGEPTLYKNLGKLICHAKNYNFSEISLVTNGRKLSDEKYVMNLIESGIGVFSVSIHSANKEIHNEIVGNDSWEETVQGIKNVVSSKIKCSINLVVTPLNQDKIVESVYDILSWGVDEIIVSCATPRIINGHIDGVFSYDPKKFGRIIEYLAEAPRNVKILHELPLCLIDKEVFLKLRKENRLGYGCHVGMGMGLAFDVLGRIIPCNSFASMPIVNMFQNEDLIYSVDEFIKKWFTDEGILDFRKEINVFRSEKCKECSLWQACSCGCPLLWGYYHPEDYINDSLFGI